MHIGCLIAIPIMMMLVNDNWLFTKLGYLDPWYNVGYFLHYQDTEFRADFYKIARASWLIPGYLIYKLFTPVVANHLLHIGSLLIMTTFIYSTIVRMVNRDVAFLTAALLTVYYPIHGSGGWDYQTTPSGAYFAVTLFFACLAGQSDKYTFRHDYLLIICGAAFAATFHANILFVNLLPIIFGIYFIYVDEKLFSKLLLKSCLKFLAGFILLTVILGLINLMIGRKFLFYSPLIEIVFNYVKDTSNEATWWMPLSLELITRDEVAGYLALPLSTLFVSTLLIIYIYAGRNRTIYINKTGSIILVAQHVYLGLLWIIWHQIGHVALAPDYFAYPLQLSALLCLAGLMGLGIDTTYNSEASKLKSKCLQDKICKYANPVLISVLFLVILVVPQISNGLKNWVLNYEEDTRSYLFYSVSLLSTLIILLSGYLSRKKIWIYSVSLSMFLVAQVAIIVVVEKPNDYFAGTQNCESGRDTFLSLLDLENNIRKFSPASLTAEILWMPNVILRTHGSCDYNLPYFGWAISSISNHYFSQSMNPPDTFANPDLIPVEFFNNFNIAKPLVVLTNDEKYAEAIRDRFIHAGQSEMQIREVIKLKSAQHEFYAYILNGVPLETTAIRMN